MTQPNNQQEKEGRIPSGSQSQSQDNEIQKTADHNRNVDDSVGNNNEEQGPEPANQNKGSMGSGQRQDNN